MLSSGKQISFLLDKYPMGVYNTDTHRYPAGVLKGAMDMAEMNETQCCAVRTKVRDEKERRELMNRLKRIEGQVRGLQRMLDEDAYCPDILTQASAVQSALNGFCRTLLASHLHSCVTEDIRAGHDEAVDELMEILKKLMK